jgi:hypothetical protein
MDFNRFFSWLRRRQPTGWENLPGRKKKALFRTFSLFVVHAAFYYLILKSASRSKGRGTTTRIWFRFRKSVSRASSLGLAWQYILPGYTPKPNTYLYVTAGTVYFPQCLTLRKRIRQSGQFTIPTTANPFMAFPSLKERPFSG